MSSNWYLTRKRRENCFAPTGVESSNSHWAWYGLLCTLRENWGCWLVDGGEGWGGLRREGFFGGKFKAWLPEDCWSHNWSHREVLYSDPSWVVLWRVSRARMLEVTDRRTCRGSRSEILREPEADYSGFIGRSVIGWSIINQNLSGNDLQSRLSHDFQFKTSSTLFLHTLIPQLSWHPGG